MVGLENFSRSLAEFAERVNTRGWSVDAAESARRREGVEKAWVNAALEGFVPDAEMRMIDELYISGRITIEEAVKYACSPIE